MIGLTHQKCELIRVVSCSSVGGIDGFNTSAHSFSFLSVFSGSRQGLSRFQPSAASSQFKSTVRSAVLLAHAQSAGSQRPSVTERQPGASVSESVVHDDEPGPGPGQHPHTKKAFTVTSRKAGLRFVKQYSQGQMEAAIADVVNNRKSVRVAAKDNGVPLSSLYEKLKLRHLQQD